MKEKLERLRALKVTLLINGKQEYVTPWSDEILYLNEVNDIWHKFDIDNDDVQLTPELESFFALIGDAEILEYKECYALSDQKPPVFALTKDKDGAIHFYELKGSVWYCETTIRTESWAHKTAALFGLDPETLL